MRRSGGCLDRSVVRIVEGQCRGRYGIQWQVTSGGIARGSGAVANCWRVQGRVRQGGVLTNSRSSTSELLRRRSCSCRISQRRNVD